VNETVTSEIEVAVEAPPEARLPMVRGERLTKMPEDLYIPPDALEVFLEAFEGPLDLLLYLIRKQNLDILDIPVLQITRQYMQYIVLMQDLKLELAAEYLVMAAWLAEIKSRILLPRPPAIEEEQGDPRMELVRRLQEYERFKTAGESLDQMPRVGRDTYVGRATPERIELDQPLPIPSLRELLSSLRDVMQRAEFFNHHTVSREPLSVRERMSRVLMSVTEGAVGLLDLLDPGEGKAGIIVTILAILELTRSGMITVQQEAPFASLTVQRAAASEAAEMPIESEYD
jgi:segregation and condensation protein A